MPEERLLATLDEFCSEATIHEPRAPLVLLGPTGAGKSALLANWLARRAASLSRRANQATLTNEFVFWHAVGCSRQSALVGTMLRRLMTDLTAHFELHATVSVDDDKLAWEFPRLLDMASRKGTPTMTQAVQMSAASSATLPAGSV